MPEPVLRLAIERLTYGPDALAHHGGAAVFVPLAAPGDVVRAEVVARRRDYLRARVEAIEAAGPDRVAAPCPVFGTCGGCPWQHVALAAQRAAKAALVTEQLARVAGVPELATLPILATPEGLGYRARVTLVAEGRRLGYHRARSHALVEVDDCLVAAPAVRAHLAAARTWAARLRTAPERVTIAAAPGGVVLVAVLPAPPTAGDRDASEALCAAVASVRGAVLAGGGARVVVGDPRVRVPLDAELALEVPADAFTQVNPAANVLLVAAVLGFVAPTPGLRVLDCYAGAGNFALPLARRGAEVTAIERAPLAVAAGRENAARLGLPARFEEASVADALARAPAGGFDTIVLDPPRAGAADAIPALAALRASRIVYVSCDLATLARDVRALVGHGYRLGRVQPLDLFPQTHHVEVVAELLSC